MSREFLGQGSEHKVYRLDYPRPLVVKKPRTFTVAALRVLFNGIETVRQEIAESEKRAATTHIKIPKTRIFPYKNAYLMVQDFIEEDTSVTNIPEYVSQGEYGPYFLNRYTNNPDNFVSSRNMVYLVDPTNDFFVRFRNKYPLLNEQAATKMKRMYTSIIRRK